MTELLVKAAFGILRIVAAPVVEWLNHNDVLTSDETTQLLMLGAALVVALGTQGYAIVKGLRERNTAAGKAHPMTPNEVKAAVSSGASAPAITAADQVPVIAPKKE